VHQALEAIEAKDGLRGVAAYAREHSNGAATRIIADMLQATARR